MISNRGISMGNIYDLYKSKVKNMDEILGMIRSEDFIITALGAGEPTEILHQLHKIRENGVKGCTLTNCLVMGNYEFIKNPEYKDTIFTDGWFFSPPLRKAHANGNVSHMPQHLDSALTKRLFATDNRRKILLASCSSMDNHGNLSLSVGTTYEKQLIDTGEAVVIVEVNPRMPRTFGDTILNINQVDAILETSHEVPAIPYVPFTEKDAIIGNYIADLVEDGATIQLGIGGIPNAVAEGLKVKKNLGIHTEMFTDGMVDLIECGAVNNSMKTLYRGKSVATFALGTQKLYDYLDDNPAVEFRNGQWTNNPHVIGQNYKMTSINTCLEIDLVGQCASEAIGTVQFSGTGGQADTAVGAQLAPGGKSVIALYSTASVKNAQGERETISKIVPILKPGSIVSLSRNDVDYVVTEYGVAWLRGRAIRERVERLINIAHPDFRDQLRFDAKKNGIW